MISEKWFSVENCRSPQDREDRRMLVDNSRGILRILGKIIDEDIKRLEQEQMTAFDKPNWTENQAKILGAMKTLKDLKSLTQTKE